LICLIFLLISCDKVIENEEVNNIKDEKLNNTVHLEEKNNIDKLNKDENIPLYKDNIDFKLEKEIIENKYSS